MGKKCFVWCFECKYCEVSENIFSTSAFYLHFSHCKFYLFKALALWVDAFYKSKCCLSVRLSVRLFIRAFTFEVPFKRLFAPIPKVGCPIFLEIRNPWGGKCKEMATDLKFFVLKWSKIAKKKKKMLDNFAYKTRWKPCFPMD